MKFSDKNLHYFFILAIIVKTSVSKTCTQSDYSAVQKCYSIFLSHYNLTINNGALPDFTNIQATRYATAKQLGDLTYRFFCPFQNHLHSCLEDFESCIDVDLFPKIFFVYGKTAADYVYDYYTSNYGCTTAFYFLNTNYACLETLWTVANDELNFCEEQLRVNVGDEKCDAYENYIKCLQNTYNQYCGPLADTYICNSEYIGFNYTVKACRGKLSKCQPLVDNEF